MAAPQSRVPHLAYSIALRRRQKLLHSSLRTERPSYELLHIRPSPSNTPISMQHNSSPILRRSHSSIPNPGRGSDRNRLSARARATARPGPSQPAPPNPIREPLPIQPTGVVNTQGRPIKFYLYTAALFTVSLAAYVAYTVTTYTSALNAYYEIDPKVKDQRDQYNSRASSPRTPTGGRLSKIPEDTDVSSRYDDWARDYDEEVEYQEFFLGMGRKRKRVVRHDVSGKVLEVGVGTGRNLRWYILSEADPSGASQQLNDKTPQTKAANLAEEGVQSLVLVDKSPQMLGLARRKWETMFDPTTREGKRRKQAERQRWAAEKEGHVTWITGDVSIKGVIPRPPGGFDAVVQTMGLCSYADPVGVLRNLGRLVRQPGEASSSDNTTPSKPNHRLLLQEPTTTITTTSSSSAEIEEDEGGSIHLLEHGRSHYAWLNALLDLAAPMHADRYGCWWNRDVGKIVAGSGLRVERVRRYHFGTTWEVVLRPGRGRGG